MHSRSGDQVGGRTVTNGIDGNKGLTDPMSI